MHFKGIRTISREELLRFLNTDKSMNRTQDAVEVHKKLIECVEIILVYKRQIQQLRKTTKDVRQLKQREMELAEDFRHDVWDDRLLVIVQSAILHIQPYTVFQRLLVGKNQLTFDDVKDVDFMEIFQEGPLLIVGSPSSVNFALSFLNLLTDPETGTKRIFRCEECQRIGLGRPDQRFCSNQGKCRNTFNNRRRDPEANRDAVRQYRKEVDEGQGPRKKKRRKDNAKKR